MIIRLHLCLFVWSQCVMWRLRFTCVCLCVTGLGIVVLVGTFFMASLLKSGYFEFSDFFFFFELGLELG